MSTTPAPLIYVISGRACISRSEYYFPLATAAAAVAERRTEKNGIFQNRLPKHTRLHYTRIIHTFRYDLIGRLDRERSEEKRINIFISLTVVALNNTSDAPPRIVVAHVHISALTVPCGVRRFSHDSRNACTSNVGIGYVLKNRNKPRVCIKRSI